ncbi:hypothetical protein [Mangrovimicrobium sediminis]|uniref:hypothetical protein n=1 Tax=Mangrovimicrobium sediminis TaxID=2562682 RepID=UPI0010819C32|nr:hypothetical protein [Haliea sp. SAOS-164]
MKTIVALLFILIFVSILIVTLVWFFNVSRLFKYLRDNHTEEYIAMGQPSMFMSGPPATKGLFMRFLRSNRPVDLGDKLLIRKCSFLKRLYIAFWGLVGALFIVGAIGVNTSS